MTKQQAFGRPVNGEISHYGGLSVEQQDPQLWVDALDELLALDYVKSVKWRQYTPYFNDGEACEFGISGVSVLLDGLDPDDDGNGFGDYGDNYLDAWSFKYNRSDLKDKFPDLDLSDESVLAQKLRHFEAATEGGAHYVMLNKTFGDPAEVIATPEGFDVEFYEHD